MLNTSPETLTAYERCARRVDAEYYDCLGTYNRDLNQTMMDMYGPLVYCEGRVNVSAEPLSTDNPKVPVKPVESVFCNLMNFFGFAC